MSIRTQFIFDDEAELIFDPTKIEVRSRVDDESMVNPFVSGTTILSGIIDGDTTGSGYITPSSFLFVSSGMPFQSSGEIVTFSFAGPTRMHSVTIYQEPTDYAVDYQIIGDGTALISVQGSTNSGTIFHKLGKPTEVSTLQILVTKINEQATSPWFYDFIEVSGEANRTFVQSQIVATDLSNLTATSNVEPVGNLFDGDSLTFWQSNNSFPQSVIWQFKNTENIANFSYVAEDTVTYPTQFQLYSSLDGVAYSAITSSMAVTSGNISIPFSPAQTMNYLKWVMTGGVGAKIRIREVTLMRRTFPQVDDNTVRLLASTHDGFMNPISLQASTQSGMSVIGLIADGDDSTYWSSNPVLAYNSGTNSYLGNEFILVDLGSPQTLDGLELTNITGAGLPIDFSIAGSNDNLTYTLIDSITGNALPIINLSYPDSVNTYHFYKITFTNSTHNFVRIGNAELHLRTYPANGSFQVPTIEADSITSFSVSGVVPYPATTQTYMVNVGGLNYWFDGSKWTVSDGTPANSSTLAVVNANLGIMNFGENFKAAIVPFLQSNGTDTPIVTDVRVVSKNEKNADFVPTGLVRIRGFLTGFPANIQKPIQIEVNLIRSVISIDGQTVGSAVQVFNSDAKGYFDFTLPQTENANPKKARWQIRIAVFNFRSEQYTPAVPEISLSNWIGGSF